MSINLYAQKCFFTHCLPATAESCHWRQPRFYTLQQKFSYKHFDWFIYSLFSLFIFGASIWSELWMFTLKKSACSDLLVSCPVRDRFFRHFLQKEGWVLTYRKDSLVLLLNMPDGNSFNRFFFISLPRIDRGCCSLPCIR